MSLTFTSCIYYKTAAVQVNQTSLAKYVETKPLWTLRDADHRTSALSAVVVRNDTVFGRLSPAKMEHPANKRTYWGNSSNEKSYLHLFADNAPEFASEVHVPVAQITSVTEHKGAPGKTIWVNSLLVVLAIIVL
jgi:hypothetical protein